MRIVFTEAIRDTFPEDILKHYINRFILGDYGNIPKQDRELNEKVLKTGSGMMMGSYSIAGETVWITRDLETSADFDVITILFPEEY